MIIQTTALHLDISLNDLDLHSVSQLYEKSKTLVPLFSQICVLIRMKLSMLPQLDQDNRPWHHLEGKPKWSSFEGSGSGRDWQALSISIQDTRLHWWFSWKCHEKWRMWCQHQVSRQISTFCVSTQWDTVLKLQSWSPSTAECHGNHHFVGREAQESSLSHRLTVSSASPHVWWTWHCAKEAHREHQHPGSVCLCCSSLDISTHRH